MNIKKGIQLLKLLKKNLEESNYKPDKIWEDKSNEFNHRSKKSWLQEDSIEMYSTHNEEKSAVAEICIRTLKNKIYKYEFNIINVFIDKLSEIANEYKNVYQIIIKMKHINVRSSTCNFGIEISDKDPTFKFGFIYEYQNIETLHRKVTLRKGLKMFL